MGISTRTYQVPGIFKAFFVRFRVRLKLYKQSLKRNHFIEVNFWIMELTYILLFFFVYFFGGLECVGYPFAYVAHFCIFEICLDSNPECAVASRRATNFAIYLPT